MTGFYMECNTKLKWVKLDFKKKQQPFNNTLFQFVQNFNG